LNCATAASLGGRAIPSLHIAEYLTAFANEQDTAAAGFCGNMRFGRASGALCTSSAASSRLDDLISPARGTHRCRNGSLHSVARLIQCMSGGQGTRPEWAVQRSFRAAQERESGCTTDACRSIRVRYSRVYQLCTHGSMISRGSTIRRAQEQPESPSPGGAGQYRGFPERV
jgi:hypothetical protein